MTTTFSFPHFVSNQLLLSADLNDIIQSLDYQDRLTRVYLHGMGIICGLKINTASDLNAITISEGFGLSSDGHLIKSESCTLKSYKKWEGFDTCEFFENQKTNLAPYKNQLYELLPDSKSGTTLASQKKGFFADKVVILFLCRTKKGKQKGSKCVENGEEYAYNIVKLLAPKAICKEENPNQSVAKSDFSSGALFLERIGHNLDTEQPETIQLCQLSPDNIMEHYKKLCNIEQEKYQLKISRKKELVKMVTVLEAAYQHYAPLLGVTKVKNPFSELKDLPLILEKLPAIFTKNTPGWQYCFQYIYDFLKDLTLAYNEFVEIVCELTFQNSITQSCPDFTLFPGCLILGGVGIEPIDCRTNFMPACKEGATSSGNIREAKFLLKRLEKLAKSFFLTGENGLIGPKNDYKVKITASKGRHLSLGERPIPYYYKNVSHLSRYWNYNFTKKNCLEKISGYEITHTEPLYQQPLRYDLDAYSFFRIEGHIGKTVKEAYEAIEQKRNHLNLPFDIKCIKLGDALLDVFPTDFAAHKEETLFNCDDLQLVYEQVKNDFWCKMELLNEEDRAPKDFTDLKNTLPQNIKLFFEETYSYQQFKDEYQAQIIIDEEEQPKYPTNPFIDCCVEAVKKVIDKLFDRRTSYLQEHLFQNFCRQHPGMEHAAGVSKGGTFILVYYEVFEEAKYQKIKEIKKELEVLDSADKIVGFLPEQKQIQLKDIYQRKKGLDGEQQFRVIADFYLPYYCCAKAGAVTLPTPEPFILIISKDFCVDQEEEIDIILYPRAGGKLTATSKAQTIEDKDKDVTTQIIRQKKDGRFYFKPSLMEAFEENKLDIVFTWEVGGQSCTDRITIWNKQQEFDIIIEDGIKRNADPKDGKHSVKISATPKGLGNYKYKWVLNTRDCPTPEEKKEGKKGGIIDCKILPTNKESFHFIFDFNRKVAYEVELHASNPACPYNSVTKTIHEFCPDDNGNSQNPNLGQNSPVNLQNISRNVNDPNISKTSTKPSRKTPAKPKRGRSKKKDTENDQ